MRNEIHQSLIDNEAMDHRPLPLLPCAQICGPGYVYIVTKKLVRCTLNVAQAVDKFVSCRAIQFSKRVGKINQDHKSPLIQSPTRTFLKAVAQFAIHTGAVRRRRVYRELEELKKKRSYLVGSMFVIWDDLWTISATGSLGQLNHHRQTTTRV